MRQAARRWALAATGQSDRERPQTLDAATRADFIALGVDPASLPPDDPEHEDDFEVWPENWQTVRLFLACETQWRASAAMSGMVWVGLDYVAVDVVARRRGLEADLADLQVMEVEALSILNGGRA
nr:DUF1799 domain-containing protein [Ancylobacter lacus]